MNEKNKREQPPAPVHCAHIGQPGDKITLTAKLVHIHSYQAKGHSIERPTITKHAHKFQDENGNIAVWYTASDPWQIGETYTFRAIVKSHGNARHDGTPETILQRCKVIPSAGNEPKPTRRQRTEYAAQTEHTVPHKITNQATPSAPAQAELPVTEAIVWTDTGPEYPYNSPLWSYASMGTARYRGFIVGTYRLVTRPGGMPPFRAHALIYAYGKQIELGADWFYNDDTAKKFIEFRVRQYFDKNPATLPPYPDDDPTTPYPDPYQDENGREITPGSPTASEKQPDGQTIAAPVDAMRMAIVGGTERDIIAAILQTALLTEPNPKPGNRDQPASTPPNAPPAHKPQPIKEPQTAPAIKEPGHESGPRRPVYTRTDAGVTVTPAVDPEPLRQAMQPTCQSARRHMTHPAPAAVAERPGPDTAQSMSTGQDSTTTHDRTHIYGSLDFLQNNLPEENSGCERTSFDPSVIRTLRSFSAYKGHRGMTATRLVAGPDNTWRRESFQVIPPDDREQDESEPPRFFIPCYPPDVTQSNLHYTQDVQLYPDGMLGVLFGMASDAPALHELQDEKGVVFRCLTQPGNSNEWLIEVSREVYRQYMECDNPKPGTTVPLLVVQALMAARANMAFSRWKFDW